MTTFLICVYMRMVFVANCSLLSCLSDGSCAFLMSACLSEDAYGLKLGNHEPF